MSLQDTHIIQKSHLKIKVRDQGSAYDIQTRVIEAFESKGMLALEEEMDRLAPAGEIISLDSLQLDLGNIALDDLEESLPQLLVLRLREAFLQAIADAGQAPKTAVKQAQALAADLALLLRFLEQGTAGWEISANRFDASALLAGILEAQADALISALRPLLRKRHVRERLSLQFAHAQILRLLDGLHPGFSRLATPLQQHTEALSAEISGFPQSAARRRALVINFLLVEAAQAGAGTQAPLSELKVSQAWMQMLQFWVQEEWISKDVIAFGIEERHLIPLVSLLSKIELQAGWEKVLMRASILKSIENEAIGKYLVAIFQERILANFEQASYVSAHHDLHRHIAAIATILPAPTLASVTEAFGLDAAQLKALAKMQAVQGAQLRSKDADEQHPKTETQNSSDAKSVAREKESGFLSPENTLSEQERAFIDNEKVAEKRNQPTLDPLSVENPQDRFDKKADDLQPKDLKSSQIIETETPSIQQSESIEGSKLDEDRPSFDEKSGQKDKPQIEPEPDALKNKKSVDFQSADVEAHDRENERLRVKFKSFQAKIDAENRAQLVKNEVLLNEITKKTKGSQLQPNEVQNQDQNAIADKLKVDNARNEASESMRQIGSESSSLRHDERTEYDANHNPWIPKSRLSPIESRNRQENNLSVEQDLVENAENQSQTSSLEPQKQQQRQGNRYLGGSKAGRSTRSSSAGKLGDKTAQSETLGEIEADGELLPGMLKRKKAENIAKRRSRWAEEAIGLEQQRQARIAAEKADAEEFSKNEKAKALAEAKLRATQGSEQDRIRAVKRQPRMQASYPYGETWGSDKIHYVNNAGLILLNPFFQPCLQDLGWLENGEFVDEEAQENAVLLMAWIASGEQEISEACLPLAKVLCGMDVGRPVRIEVDLPQRALDEAIAMMEAAAGYWEKAGKLAPDQLRGAFLMRDGRLQDITSGWNLKVDRQTIDILLEFLPWGYGTIMLPWMRKLLTVDW